MSKKNPNLTVEQKLVMFEDGTEPPGTSELNNEKRNGSYHCANCGIKLLKFYLNQLNEENFDYVFYIAGVDIHFNDRLGKLKISDEGIKTRDEIVIENFFSKNIPLCGVLGGGYNKDFNKLVELHSYLHQSCAELISTHG